MAEAVVELLERAARREAPLEELRALRLAVQAVPPAALRARLSDEHLAALFTLLSSSEREQLSACVAVLERLLQALDPLYVIQNLREELRKGLFHPDDSVKILSISQVGRIVENSDAVREILNSPELLRQIINCIGGEKIAVAKELIVEISSVSADSLNYCANSGLISDLIGELTGDDVLVRATCIEMVTSLAHSPHGRQYLAQQGIIDKISNIIIGAESDPFSGFYLPGFIKFFGNLAVVDSPQQICERYPVFMEKVFEMAESHDPTMNGVAVDTLGILGSSVEGKQVLQKARGRFQNLLNKIGHQAKNAPTELRLRCLDAVSSLLYLPPEQQTEDLLRMTESWFSSLSSQPLELFRSISTQPFPDLHCGALRVFTAIANQAWAQKLMLNSPGFVEYIVDRSVEPDKASKDAKYELVKALVNSKTIAEIFGNQYYLRLRAYLNEGPYYVKAVSTTAVEGAE
ncbi:26S proteasome non-ATPase regulatory subunit 5 isoform X1 [Gallus gallus]|uniref:26S proteasome non-ATPase regulatory subunit 5 isoform X1 n=1 Tax=Gallus gallus TaxID=9031 RepID=UPI001F010A68|nr:26S proteasome non-ATPase regulatory subunit 5 isoform X1 [Gallus gallus]XP_046784866.1 26S proteasome non-ATPase regulatory subunit 5 isoform X1 [Gallus gallus]